MKITRNVTETAPGPSDWFTGEVFIDAVAAPSGLHALSAASVHFRPGARTAWHTHPLGQTIWRHGGGRALPAAGRTGRGDQARRPGAVRAR